MRHRRDEVLFGLLGLALRRHVANQHDDVAGVHVRRARRGDGQHDVSRRSGAIDQVGRQLNLVGRPEPPQELLTAEPGAVFEDAAQGRVQGLADRPGLGQRGDPLHRRVPRQYGARDVGQQDPVRGVLDNA